MKNYLTLYETVLFSFFSFNSIFIIFSDSVESRILSYNVKKENPFFTSIFYTKSLNVRHIMVDVIPRTSQYAMSYPFKLKAL